MKKLNYLWMLLLTVFSLGLTACSDDDDNQPAPSAPAEAGQHFDLWVALDRHGGMGRDVQTLVRSVNSLDNPDDVISFRGEGTEVNQKLTLETIVKGAYYYQVPVSPATCFGKYLITDNTIRVVQEQRFETNTYNARKYCYAWLPNNTLLIMAANGDADKILYTKLNANDMTIISEGEVNIPLPETATMFTTSGIATYRESDNTLFYFYYGKKPGGRTGVRTSPFHIAVINPDDMSVRSDVTNSLADEMVGSAYGELLQKISFTDERGNLYLACFSTVDGNERSHLLRINPGEFNFDPDYDGFTNSGKLIACEYAGNGKAVAYARDDQYGTKIDDFSHYYTIIDLNSSTNSRLAYNGTPLPYSGGRFSSRLATSNGKVYVGIDADGAAPQIYIYDTATGNVTKGASLQSGVYFEQIRVLDNI